MRVKPVHPEHAVGLIDPQTRRSPFIDPDTKGVLESAEVPENNFWVRRLLAGEVVRVADVETAQPVGNEPIQPLTTRS